MPTFDPALFDAAAFDVEARAQPRVRLGPGGTPLPASVVGPKLSSELKIAVIHLVPAPEVVIIDVPAETFEVTVPVADEVVTVVPGVDHTVIVPEHT
jgi:hypothetical protein